MKKNLILLLIMFVAACATVDVTKTAKGFYDPTNPNEIEILKTKPSQEFEELASITVTNFEPSAVAKMHNAIRVKSAAVGASAVLLTDEGIDSYRQTRWAIGVAIRYKRAPASQGK